MLRRRVASGVARQLARGNLQFCVVLISHNPRVRDRKQPIPDIEYNTGRAPIGCDDVLFLPPEFSSFFLYLFGILSHLPFDQPLSHARPLYPTRKLVLFSHFPVDSSTSLEMVPPLSRKSSSCQLWPMLDSMLSITKRERAKANPPSEMPTSFYAQQLLKLDLDPGPGSTAA